MPGVLLEQKARACASIGAEGMLESRSGLHYKRQSHGPYAIKLLALLSLRMSTEAIEFLSFSLKFYLRHILAT